MSIRAIIIAALGIVSAIILILLVAGIFFSSSLRRDYAMIDLAGQTQYRIYRFAYIVEEMEINPEKRETLEKELNTEIEEFEKILLGLKNGEPRLGLIKTADKRTADALGENLKQWENIKKTLKGQAQLSSENMKYLEHEYLENNLLLFSRSMDGTASLLEETLASKVMRYKEGLVVLSAISFVTLGFIFTVLTRRIIGPLSSITKGIEEIKKGDFNRQIEVGYPDELGRVGAAYNEMVASLRETIERKRDLIENLPVAIIESTKDGNIKYLNKIALAWSGYNKEEILGRRLTEFIPRENRGRIEEALKTVLGGVPVRELQTPVALKGGVSRFEFNIAPIVEGKEVVGLRCVSKDIEKTKKMLDELERAKKEAEETSEKLRRTVKDLEEFALIAARREMKMQKIREGFKPGVREKGQEKT